MKLRPDDKRAIEQQIAQFERDTGVQVVVSVVDRCDSYPELPWRGFALGSALAALAVWAVPWADTLLYHSTTYALVAVLGAGACMALLSIFAPVTGRWLLPLLRRDAEIRQYAQAQFLKREMFATPERRAVLMLLALFERRAVVIRDRGLSELLPPAAVERIETLLNTSLATGGPLGQGVGDALAYLRSQLTFAATPSNLLPDAVIEERGA